MRARQTYDSWRNDPRLRDLHARMAGVPMAAREAAAALQTAEAALTEAEGALLEVTTREEFGDRSLPPNARRGAEAQVERARAARDAAAARARQAETAGRTLARMEHALVEELKAPRAERLNSEAEALATAIAETLIDLLPKFARLEHLRAVAASDFPGDTTGRGLGDYIGRPVAWGALVDLLPGFRLRVRQALTRLHTSGLPGLPAVPADDEAA